MIFCKHYRSTTCLSIRMQKYFNTTIYTVTISQVRMFFFPRRRRRNVGNGSTCFRSRQSNRCDRIFRIFRLRNDLYCVEWGVKLYSLTHSSSVYPRQYPGRCSVSCRPTRTERQRQKRRRRMHSAAAHSVLRVSSLFRPHRHGGGTAA